MVVFKYFDRKRFSYLNEIFLSTEYGNVTLVGNFNIKRESESLIDFSEMAKLEHLILKPFKVFNPITTISEGNTGEY